MAPVGFGTLQGKKVDVSTFRHRTTPLVLAEACILSRLNKWGEFLKDLRYLGDQFPHSSQKTSY